jgi:hypothetical protein
VPPRFAYWTILIDNAPTAFRARDAAELLPTLNQLKRKNKDVVLKWFARGRLWETQQQERDDFQQRKRKAGATRPKAAPKRGRDWRPGGAHKDPRARFGKPEKKGPRRSSHGGERAGKPRDRQRERPPREVIRNKAHKKAWDEGPRRDERRDQPERKEQEPPPRRPERPTDTPESPPTPEQIVIKPEPPERG